MSTDKGIKLDTEKPRMDLVFSGFSKALQLVGDIGTYGAVKYTDNGWQEVDNGIERYLSAMLRHYFKYKDGEYYDRESELPHLAHMAWNALAVLELSERGHLTDECNCSCNNKSDSDVRRIMYDFYGYNDFE